MDSNNQKKYAWILESPVISPAAYEFIGNNHNKFDLIFTFSKELLAISDKFILTPLGGCWINDEDKNIHEKSKEVLIEVIPQNAIAISFISSFVGGTAAALASLPFDNAKTKL